MTATQDATLLLDDPIGRHGRVAIRLPAAEIRIVAEDGTGDRPVAGRPRPAGAGDPRDHGRRSVDPRAGHARDHLRDRPEDGRPRGRRPPEADVTVDTASGSVVGRGSPGRPALPDCVRRPPRGGRIGPDRHQRRLRRRIPPAGRSGRARREDGVGRRPGRGRSLAWVRAQTTSGDIRLDSPLAGNTTHAIETLSGDVSVVAAAGLRVEARTISGDLTSELPHRTEGRAGSRVIVIGDGAGELAFRSVSGDLRIRGAGPADGGRPALPAPPRRRRMPAAAAGPVRGRVDPLPRRCAGGQPGGRRRHSRPDPLAEERLGILRALESGELDVAAAMGRLAELDDREARR